MAGSWIERALESFKNINVYQNTMDYSDWIEIVILTVLIYYILAWIKTTRAWSLLKGVVVIAVFLLIAYFMQMTTILWIAKSILSFFVIAMVVVLQPELRKALEELGRKNIISSVLPFEATHASIKDVSENAINEIVKASIEMGKVRTGALIVIEKNESLSEYEHSGIAIDGIVSSQLLINIFEHNTPLHDGAVVIRGDRVVSATCYLPLSDNLGISKELGTRHRAGVGISEATDSVTVIVSEETGKVSVAFEGELSRNLNAESLRAFLREKLITGAEESKTKIRWKGRTKAKE